TDHPWGLQIDPANRPPEFAAESSFHPTFLYESLFNLVNAIVLVWVAVNIPRRRWLHPGDGLALYCVMYGGGRLIVEGLRTDSLYIGPLPGPVWASAAFIVAGFVIALAVRRAEKPLSAAID
nr:prolipoprotein diacylglyceryl transferase [Chloroflexia bacterium]